MEYPLLIVDGANTFIRAYCANPHMDANGERIGGTIGMLRSLKKLLTDFRPSNALVVWDGEGGSQRRKQVFHEYKAGRTVRLNRTYEFGETPEQGLENLRRQQRLAVDYLTLLGVPQVRCDGVEADDLIAYLAQSVIHQDGIVVVTTDQDMLQLVRSRGPDVAQVSIWSPVKKVLYDRDRFISEYGVLPENFRFVKAICGDKSDNIPGIKGIGTKTAVKMLPRLSSEPLRPSDVWADVEALDESTLRTRLIDEKLRYEQNLELVDLSSPMLSATAARQAREALGRELNCRELDLRMRMVRDSTTMSDDGLERPFREFNMRRKNLLTKQERAEIEYVREQIFRAINIPREYLMGDQDLPEDYSLPKRSGTVE